MRIDRMLSIIVMLLNQKRVAAKDLAQKFEVSIRTVYRDIDAINLAGIPVISYPGNNGGFGIMDNYKLDRQVLSFQDMLSMLSALKGINTSLEDQRLDSAIQKISSLIPRDKTDELKLHFEQIVIDVLPWGTQDIVKKTLKVINKAITNNLLLNFDYRSAKGEYTNRSIEPMTLIFKSYSWYLFGYCRIREDYRVFKVSRMREILLEDSLFSRREASYLDYMKLEESQNAKMTTIRLLFSSKVQMRVEDYFLPSDLEYQDNGDMIATITFPEDEWVYSFIMAYGDQVKVLEPAHIRDIICNKAQNIIKKYQS